MADLLRTVLAEETLDQATLAARLPKRIAQAVLLHLRQLIPCRRASVVLFDLQTHESLLLAVDSTGETTLTADSRLPFAAPNLTASPINLDTFKQG
jgi:hypothetical protein